MKKKSIEDTDLEKFRTAHKVDFEKALSEIKNGRKQSHWMWYIFPQIAGLGKSEMSRYYAIEDTEMAYAFLNDEYLGENLRKIARALLELETDEVVNVMGFIDARKLKSSMTLFDYVGGRIGENRVFYEVLKKYYVGLRDEKTMEIIISEMD